MWHFLLVLVSVVLYAFCIGVIIVVALQTSRSEGLSGILAGGGGGGGKVGKERGLEKWSQWLCYGWLVLALVTAVLRG